jgi:hypothetical protein
MMLKNPLGDQNPHGLIGALLRIEADTEIQQ